MSTLTKSEKSEIKAAIKAKIEVLNPCAREVLETLAQDKPVDTKDNSVKSAVGLLLRRELITKTSPGCYIVSKDVKSCFMFEVKKHVIDTPKNRKANNKYLSAEQIRYFANLFLGIMTENELCMKRETMYNNNVCIALEEVKKLRFVEIRSCHKVRVMTTSELIKSTLGGLDGFEISTASNGGTFYIDAELSVTAMTTICKVLKAYQITERIRAADKAFEKSKSSSKTKVNA